MITIIDDNIALEGNEKFCLVLSTSESNVALGTQNMSTITIIDNDGKQLKIGQVVVLVYLCAIYLYCMQKFNQDFQEITILLVKIMKR